METKSISLDGTYSDVKELTVDNTDYPLIGHTRDPLASDDEYFDFIQTLAENELKIIDFGGGLGIHYNYLIRKGISKKMTYYIVEIPEIAKKKVDGVSFFTELGQIRDTDNITVFFSNSGLQYTKNIFDTLLHVCSMRPKYLCFSRIPIINYQTHLSVQHWGGSNIPYWLLNGMDLGTIAEAEGYEQMYRKVWGFFPRKTFFETSIIYRRGQK